MLDKPWLAAGLVLAVAATAVLIASAAHFSFFFLPFTWTDEPARLAALLGIRSGDRVADIGAGDGSHAIAIAQLVGEGGEVLASDIDPDRRRSISDRAVRAHASNVRVVEAVETSTNLADRCCQAIYMRTMFHHVKDATSYAKDVVRSLQPGGRVAVIDFAPGHLWFHGRDHGVTPEIVQSAFISAGCTLRHRDDHWGGPTFLLLFECGR
jgi:ubiquinone/menaquinone biosynthesis C-methylase UbiE